MAKKTVPFIFVILLLASSIAAACSPNAASETSSSTQTPATSGTTGSTSTSPVPTGNTVTLSLKKLDGTSVENTVEKPQYGGTLALLEVLPAASFDPFLTPQFFNGYRYFTNEAFFYGDWGRGPAGTNETDWISGFGGNTQLLSGAIAESWEMPDTQTIIWHIRQGVHWWNKPPTNGREVTADDVVWDVNRYFTMPKSYFYSYTALNENPTSIKALDNYTVELKFPAGVALASIMIDMGGNMPMYPPDVTQQYGDNKDWHHLTGTGPYMLLDFVQDSMMTYERNPDYWQHDPVFPENQLPYVDKLITYHIDDASTRQAAFRTAKIYALYNNTWDDFQTLEQQIPSLQYKQQIGAAYEFVLSGRLDKTDLPFSDVRVRQALNMAVDKQAMIDGYFEGKAQMLAFPVPDAPAYPYYVPLDQQPQAVQDLFTYNPDKAKQLLAEAGYPDGFQTTVIVNSSSSAATDLMSIVQKDLVKVGVDMQIKPVENGVFQGVFQARSHEQMIYAQTDPSNAYLLLPERLDQHWDTSYWHDPKVDQAVATISEDLRTGNEAGEVATLKEINSFILEQAWGVWLPQPYLYNAWWPWLKNCYGVWNVGYNAQGRNWTYVWIDQALKKSMGH